jgi:hypothetical protein
MLSAMTRAAAVGLPWIAVMAVSVGLAYGMDVAVTSGVSVTTPAEESVSGVIARPDSTGFETSRSQECRKAWLSHVDVAVGDACTVEQVGRGSEGGNEGCLSHGWMIYIGLGTWLPDPNRAAFCRDESTTPVRGVP